MTATRVVVCLCALTIACGAASAQGQAAEGIQPPEGVMIQVLPPPEKPAPDQGVKAPAETGDGQEAPFAGIADEPKITLAYEGVPFGEALDDLSQRMGVIVLCRSRRVRNVKYYRRGEFPRSVAVQAACAPMLQQADATYIICTQDELRENDGFPTVKTEKRINIKLENAVLGEALSYATELTGVQMTATDALLEKKVNYEANDVTIPDALTGIAEAVEGACTTGYDVKLVQFDSQLDEIEQMSDEELETMFRKGIDAAKSAGTEAFGSPEQAQTEMQGRFGAGMQDAMRVLGELDPETRKEVIQMGVQLIGRFQRVTQRLSPETQADLKSMAKPFLGVALGGYLALPPKTRSHMAPIMRALNAFGW